MLGGTAFLGRAVVAAALARGHAVTCLARGSAPVPDGAVLVRGDRDAADGLDGVAGREWDAVVDVSRQPGQVRRSVATLRTPHHVLVSTGNVYARFDVPGQDEDAPLLAPLEGDVMADMSAYGPAKVACEEAVRAGAGSATIARAGLIGGPGDTTGRSGYWPWRFAHPSGPDVVVPDDPTFPCSVVDVRDLAAWLVTAAERRVAGTFNTMGPTLPLAEVLATAAAVAGATVPARPVPVEVLTAHGVAEWMGPRSLPLWVADPDWRYFCDHSTARAVAAGFVTRPLADTLRDALAFEEARETLGAGPRLAGLTDAEEQELRAALP